MEKITRQFLGAFKERVPVLLRNVLLGILFGYQKLISPALGNRCRFYPSCSMYASEILRSDSIPLCRSLLFVARRLLRCHPYCKGGIDLPPTTTTSVKKVKEI